MKFVLSISSAEHSHPVTANALGGGGGGGGWVIHFPRRCKSVCPRQSLAPSRHEIFKARPRPEVSSSVSLQDRRIHGRRQSAELLKGGRRGCRLFESRASVLWTRGQSARAEYTRHTRALRHTNVHTRTHTRGGATLIVCSLRQRSNIRKQATLVVATGFHFERERGRKKKRNPDLFAKIVLRAFGVKFGRAGGTAVTTVRRDQFLDFRKMSFDLWSWSAPLG